MEYKSFALTWDLTLIFPFARHLQYLQRLPGMRNRVLLVEIAMSYGVKAFLAGTIENFAKFYWRISVFVRVQAYGNQPILIRDSRYGLDQGREQTPLRRLLRDLMNA